MSESFYDGLPQVEQQSNVKLEAAQSSVELYPALQSMQSKLPGLMVDRADTLERVRERLKDFQREEVQST